MAEQHDYHESTDPWSRFSAADSHTGESSGASRLQQQPTDPSRWASEEGTSPRAPPPPSNPEDTPATRVPNRDFPSRPSPAVTISSSRMPQYTSRDVGDPSQIKKNKQSMADLKLRRLTELNSRLREDLERERIPVSQASKSIIAYCNSTRDYMVPNVWGPVPKGDDPYAPQQSGGCCIVM
ncbi:guanine nucleotide-binding protein subunit-like protein [Parachaetomium inaequale]|uniref:Guanine nucleotide-binding protein subunit gamma n=1 Tax=Parachaetomium inaequale TaxID=2588326 RepID=A0AAN6PLP6_9PEZI|nr:guanine nucleotide-binding protein subunit-like protein [Parachaetomium inaequale]